MFLRLPKREVPVMANALKLSIATLAFGASGSAVALAIAVTGLWLIGLATGDASEGVRIASLR